MNKRYLICSPEGEIRRSTTCPESQVAIQMAADEYVVEGEANDVTQYVDTVTWEVKDKPPLPAVLSKTTLAADGVDSITVSGLPVPCQVVLDKVQYEVPDGEFEFTVDLPGEYTLSIQVVNYLPFDTTVTAT